METNYLVFGCNGNDAQDFSDSFKSYNEAKSHADDLKCLRKIYTYVIIKKVETEEIYRAE